MKQLGMNNYFKKIIVLGIALIMAIVCFSIPTTAAANDKYAIISTAYDMPVKGIVAYAQEFGAALTRFYVYEDEDEVQISIMNKCGMYYREDGDYQDIVFLISEATASNATVDLGILSPYAKDINGQLMSNSGNQLKSSGELVGTKYSGAFIQGGVSNVGYFIIEATDIPTILNGNTESVSEYVQVILTYNGNGLPTTPVRQGLSYYVPESINSNTALSSASKTFGFAVPTENISMTQQLSNPNATIGDTITVTLTVRNESNMWLDNVMLDIYNSFDETSTKRLSNMTNVTINGVPVSDINSISLGNWEGLNSYRPRGGTPSSADYHDFIITYDYLVSAADLIENEIPLRAKVSATSPNHTIDFNKFISYEYPNTGAPVTHIVPLSDDDLDVLDIDGLCTITYNPNTGEGTAYTVADIIGNTHHILDNDIDNNLGFTKEGFSFKGWNTQADGKGVMYYTNDPFIMIDGNTIVYAIWEENTIPTPDPDPTPNPDPKKSSEEYITISGTKTPANMLVKTGDTNTIMIYALVSGVTIIMLIRKHHQSKKI